MQRHETISSLKSDARVDNLFYFYGGFFIGLADGYIFSSTGGTVMAVESPDEILELQDQIVERVANENI